MLFVDLVQDLDLFLVGPILVVDGLQDGGQGPRSESEGEHADDHDNDAKDLFDPGVDADVSIPDGCNRRDGEVKAGEILLIGTQF
jgi:hypothetical protein